MCLYSNSRYANLYARCFSRVSAALDIIKAVAFVIEYFNSGVQPIVMELCMLGNFRAKIFGINIVFINPLLARQVRLRLKSL